MKKLTKLVLIGTFALGAMTMISCDKGGGKEGQDDGNNASTETTAEFDESNFGLYKGVIAGSTGTIKIEINNGDDVAKATIVIDGETDELTTTATFIEGQPILNAEFTGETSSFSFSVNANGGNPVIMNIIIDGHENVIATVTKEKSEDVSVCYEGTSVGGQDHSGVFNVVRNNNTFSGVSKGVDGFTCIFSGTIKSDGSFSGTTSTIFNGLDVDLAFEGEFDGNNVSGTWSNSWVTPDGHPGSNSGTFTGKKTL